MDTTSTQRVDDLLVHGAWLRRLASSLVVQDGDADDLVQEAWLAALVRGPARRGQARGWLARVLRNRAGSRARTHGARLHREEENARPESLPSAAVLAGRADMSRRLVEFVLELPPDIHRVVLARYFEGLSSAEIARRLGRPTGSVRSQLKRGLDQLRQRLDADNEGERERWLTALSPLVLPRGGASGLGVVLAASTGLRYFVCAAVLLMAAGVFWIARGPDPEATPPTVAGDAHAAELESVDAPSPVVGALEPAEPAERRAPVETETEPAVAKSPIEGRVVHPETGEAVVWFELGILPAELAGPFEVEVTEGTPMPWLEELELVRTDEEGRFATSSAYATGSYAIVPVEDWRVAHPRIDTFDIRQPRPPEGIEHDATGPVPHTLELETGPVFVVDCPKAIQVGAQNMVAVYSYLDHFPPGYFRPSPLQVDPVPFVRMHTDFAHSKRSEVDNLRLVSVDGFWSGSVPMTIPDSIATQHVSFELSACAVVDVALDFGERHPPPFVALHYWHGAVDPTAEDAPEPDIVELQATFDGTLLDEAIVKYMRTGTATVGIEANTCEYWHRVVELLPGHNALEAAILPNPDATGRIEGRVVHLGEGPPEQIVRVIANATVDGEPAFQSMDLEFHELDGTWIAEFAFTHMPRARHVVWFDKGGAVTHDPKAFAVEPSQVRVDVDEPVLEFQLHTDLTRTKLRVRAKDAFTGEKIKDFIVVAYSPGEWVQTRRAESRASRVSLTLLGKLEGAAAMVGAAGYARTDFDMDECTETSKGLEMEVELTPGWGGPLWVEDADTGERLVGVRVLVDGDEVGVTDEAGELQLAVPSAPERVDFELEGFEVTDRAGLVDSEGGVRPASGDPIRQYIEVEMREPE